MRHIKQDDPRLTSLLVYIKDYKANNGFSPSTRDIMNGLGLSSTSVALWRLGILEEYGLIKRTPEISRSIVVIKKEQE